MTGAFRHDGGGDCYFGLYPAIVTDIVDTENLGRIEVKFPWLGEKGEQDVRAWATLLTPYADDDQGIEILPAVDSQVVVGFDDGSVGLLGDNGAVQLLSATGFDFEMLINPSSNLHGTFMRLSTNAIPSTSAARAPRTSISPPVTAATTAQLPASM